MVNKTILIGALITVIAFSALSLIASFYLNFTSYSLR